MVDHLIQACGVIYLGGYRLRILFSDGAVRDVDLENQLWGPVFEPLKDTAFFARAVIDPETWTLCWPNGADMATDALYEMGAPVAAAASNELPFEMKQPRFNQKTEMALREAGDVASGKIAAKRYSSAKKLFTDLDAE